MKTLFTDIDYLSKDYSIMHGYILVERNSISYVGTSDPRQYPEFDLAGAQEISGANKLLIPGLYNIHTHVPMTLLRGYAEGLPLDEWLHTKVFPFEDLMTPDAVLPATELAIAEMLRFGTVGFSDMYNFTEERAEAVRSSGIKANLAYGVLSFDPEQRYEDMPQRAIVEELVQSFHNTCEERLKIDLFVHSEYLSNPYIVKSAGEHAQELGVNTHIHLSETAKEHEEGKQRRGGLTPTQYLDSHDFFAQPCTAAHCVWTEPADWELLTSRGVTVAHNPCSNAKLASGIMPLKGMLDAEVKVGLGTDGVASNNNHNLLKEVYAALLFARARELDPAIITSAQVLAMATIHGAQSQGRNHCGTIEPGASADLVMLDLDGPWMQPAHDLSNNLLFSAQGSDICLTMVDGKVLYNNGEWLTIDVERAAALTSQAARDIVATLKP